MLVLNSDEFLSPEMDAVMSGLCAENKEELH